MNHLPGRFCVMILTIWGSLFTQAQASHALSDAPYCREYTQPIKIGGRIEEGYGQACLQPDGSWQKVDDQGQPLEYEEAFLNNSRVIIHEERVFVPPVYTQRVSSPSFSLVIGDRWGWRGHDHYRDHHHSRHWRGGNHWKHKNHGRHHRRGGHRRGHCKHRH